MREKTRQQRLLFESLALAVLIGGALASYILLTPFWLMPHNRWLMFHNLLVIVSLALAAFIGYKHRLFQAAFGFMLFSVAAFFTAIMFMYIGSYVVTTSLFAERMVWIPFFYHDYNYHGFKSVSDYLNHNHNFRALIELQIFSFLISSVMYFGAGSLGYGARATVEARGTMKRNPIRMDSSR